MCDIARWLGTITSSAAPLHWVHQLFAGGCYPLLLPSPIYQQNQTSDLFPSESNAYYVRN